MADTTVNAAGISALTSLVIDLMAHQMATTKLLQRAGPHSAQEINQEVQMARNALTRIPTVSDFQSHMSSEHLVALEASLRNILRA